MAGGLPGGRVHLLQGSPGSGKTTIALQFLLEGLRQGERCLYVSMSESRDEVLSVAESHGWSLADLTILDASQAVPEDENTLFQPSEVELGERMDAILGEVDRVRPTRLVVDSCTELRLLAHTQARYRRQIMSLKRQLADRDGTVLLIDNPAPDVPDVLLQSLAHGVIVLEHVQADLGGDRRRLRVMKMRGVAYRGGPHDFVIRTGGVVVFPRLVAAEFRAPMASETFATGLAPLDALLGGGLARGTSTLVMGPAGSGKSALSTLCAVRAASTGEHAAIFSFDESTQVALARSRSLGMDLGPHVSSGRISLDQIDPAELSPGELVHRIRAAVEERGARVVVLDSVNGLIQAMPNENFMMLQLHELLMYLSQRGVLTVIVLAQHGIVGEDVAGPADVSYLADTVVLLRYYEAQGAVRKAISVVKKRTGAHETTIREYVLDGNGLHVGEPLTAFRGVLSGVPVYDSPPPAAP
ncbi:ATPase domain-containing protein [Anaeromyxobacter oryzae]|uniref:non-specific serine/threonine protein kinase n=1 Tax=Anaeromyxobacter oryzae TaxID=2918170 RepID=A0ABN6MUV5_9BACT|nr:ATPase domain-containing protein [Anaeromyxobacter oryzae]BDG04721.1 circadian clock protein KaiC [Anaeromyxobacter oryzae]